MFREESCSKDKISHREGRESSREDRQDSKKELKRGRYCLYKMNKQKNRSATRSLHSIDRYSGSLAYQVKENCPQHSTIDALYGNRDLHSFRQICKGEKTRKNIIQLHHINDQGQKGVKDGSSLVMKEKKVKDCIELMKGVLE